MGSALLTLVPPELMFLLTAAVVILGGARLARDGDTIADRSGLGATLVGAILVAGATSLPEIATDVAAVRQGETNLAIGDLFGSSMANMLILGVVDLLTRQPRLLIRVDVDQALVGVLAIGLTTIAAAGIVAATDFTILGLGWAPLTIAAGYLLGMRLLHANRAALDAPSPSARGGSQGLRRPMVGFLVATTAILIAAPFLASSAADLAVKWGLSSGFFGILFLAAATSLPEVAVVVTAIRNKAYALAVGNLFGSNCFNMLILFIMDVANGPVSIFAEAEAGVIVAALFAMLMMAQQLLDLLNRAEHRIWYLEPGPALVVVTYAAGLLLAYRSTH